jgi:hypothetical protein
VPGAQATASAVPPAQKVPTWQGAHTGGEMAVPGAVCTVPAAHAPWSRQVAWLLPLEY